MSGREIRFAVMLLITMAMSTLSFFVVVVVASEIEVELDISKLQLGLLGAANTGVAGLFGVQAGRICDRFGGRASMGFVLAIAGVTAVIMAVFQSYVGLLVGMSLAGFAQGLGNPATNKAIAAGIHPHRRGLLTGLKQSGVQLAVFAAGFAMPTISERAGWRTGLWIMAGICAVAILGLSAISERDHDDVVVNPLDEPTAAGSRLPLFVYQVGLFGFLLGCVGGGIGRFTPLFAEEAVGFSARTAGIVFGLSGLVAIPARVISGVLLDRGLAPRRMLVLLGFGGTIALALTLLAEPGPNSLLWVGTVLSGLTLGTWNTAANLAMIRQGANAGRASGILVLGFMFGLTVAGPIVGWSIDFTDSYAPALIGSMVLAIAGALLLLARRDAGEEPAPA